MAEAAPSQQCVLLMGHDRGWSEAASSLAVGPSFCSWCSVLVQARRAAGWGVAAGCRRFSPGQRCHPPRATPPGYVRSARLGSQRCCGSASALPCPPGPPRRALQGRPIGLGNSHAALLESEGESWAEALEGPHWRLVDVLVPQVGSSVLALGSLLWS